MTIRKLILAGALVAFAGPAFAFHCPGAMAKIDEALAASSGLDEATVAEVKELRAEGENLHKAGKHYAAMAALWTAERVLGIEDEKSEEVLHIGDY